MRILLALASTVLLCACDSGSPGGGGIVTPTPTPTPANTPPTITSATTANFAENATGIAYQTTATDAQGDAITYTLSGTDAARFTLNATGALSFVAAPDFEKPGDANADNVYSVQIRAADAGGSTMINLNITVTNVADVHVRRIAGATTTPMDLVLVPGTSRILTADRNGTVSLIDTAAGEFDSVAQSQVLQPGTDGVIRGSLNSIALAPDYATSGKLYVGAFNAGWEIRRYARLANGAPDPATADVILRFPAGSPLIMSEWIAFGPDGYLYFAVENTGPAGTGSNLASPAGKLMRIDVNSDAYPADPNNDYAIPAGNPFVGTAGALPEIYAYGLESPRRASFDGPNLILSNSVSAEGGVQRVYVVRPGDAGRRFGGGMNQIRPVIEYALTTPQGLSTYNQILGGFVYRGTIPALTGKYLFADYYYREFWAAPASSMLPGGLPVEDGFETVRSLWLPSIVTMQPGFNSRPIRMAEGPAGSLILLYEPHSSGPPPTSSMYLAEWR